MRKPVRIALRIVGGLVGLVLLVVLVTSAISEMRQRKHYDVAGKAVAIPSDSASLARGKVLATLYGCTGCHTPTLAGRDDHRPVPIARSSPPRTSRADRAGSRRPTPMPIGTARYVTA